jgi:hypothetical protein
MSDDPHAASPSTFLIADGDLGLATDLYQLTMAAAYHARAAGGPMPRATFQLSVRRLPAHRNFLVFAGLEQALGALAEVRFGPEQLDYLRRLEVFSHVSDGFFDTLAGFRFGGAAFALRGVTRGLGHVFGELLAPFVGGRAAGLAERAVDDQIRIAADGRREMGVRLGRQPEVPQVGRVVPRLLHRPQEQKGNRPFLGRAANLLDELLEVAGSRA